MADVGWLQWTMLLLLTAILLSLVAIGQVVAVNWAAYLAAPHEVAAFIDTVDFSIQENESYDGDLAKVQRLEDKIRLGRLLREIQKGGDDLREQLNCLLLTEGATTLKTTTRLLWAWKRSEMQARVQRLDLLRMRFLVVYMGIIAATAHKPPPPPPPPPPLPVPREAEKSSACMASMKPALPKALADSIAKRPPLRRLTTQAIGHHENVTSPHRRGWAGVVEELQTSPRMHQRHASIEQAMARSPP